jgi:hypothetical protein
MKLRAALRARILSKATVERAISSERPANSGGGVPAPGEYGFFIGSIYIHLIMVYPKAIIYNKLDIIKQNPFIDVRELDII